MLTQPTKADTLLLSPATVLLLNSNNLEKYLTLTFVKRWKNKETIKKKNKKKNMTTSSGTKMTVNDKKMESGRQTR